MSGRLVTLLKVWGMGMVTLWLAGGVTALTHPFFNPWYLGVTRYIGYMVLLSGVLLGVVGLLIYLENGYHDPEPV